MAQRVGRDGDAGHKGTAVERAVEVEDEVAKAVEDGAVAVSLHVLRRVRVVAYYGVGPGVDEQPGLVALPGHGVGGVLSAPVQAHNDAGLWLAAAQGADGVAQAVNGSLADTGA